ncbi:MAG: peroxiredoxin family protein [Acidiferrobacterales bacterium]
MSIRVAAAIAAIICFSAAPMAMSAQSASPAMRNAPDFTLKDLDGKAHRLSDYRGKLVIVNFWATWCPPCRREMPSMERLYEQLKGRQFVILGVEVGEGWDVVQPFVEQMKVNYPILLDRNAAISQKWHLMGLPTSYVIDPQGRIAAVIVGGRDWMDPGLRAQMVHLLPPRH